MSETPSQKKTNKKINSAYTVFKTARDINRHFIEKESKMTNDTHDVMKMSLNYTSNHASKVEDVHIFHLRNFTSISIVCRSIHMSTRKRLLKYLSQHSVF